MYTTAIIVAGGRGARMHEELPKQFLEIGGRPILMHTIEAFSGLCQEIIVVLPKEHFSKWEELCKEHNFAVNHTIECGDTERFGSVKKGLLRANKDSEIVMIHDGVRPFIDPDLIDRLKKATNESGAAAPTIPITDTLRRVDGGTISRSDVMAMQTPQTFRYQILMESYEQPYNPSFTDDVSVVEAAGHSVEFIEGDVANFKITTPYDLFVARKLISK